MQTQVFSTIHVITAPADVRSARGYAEPERHWTKSGFSSGVWIFIALCSDIHAFTQYEFPICFVRRKISLHDRASLLLEVLLRANLKAHKVAGVAAAGAAAGVRLLSPTVFVRFLPDRSMVAQGQGTLAS